MELFMQEVEFMKIPIILTLVWYAFMLADAHYRKKVTCGAEILMLVINIVWTAYIAVDSIIRKEDIDNIMILFGWMAIFVLLEIAVIQDFRERYTKNTNR